MFAGYQRVVQLLRFQLYRLNNTHSHTHTHTHIHPDIVSKCNFTTVTKIWRTEGGDLYLFSIRNILTKSKNYLGRTSVSFRYIEVRNTYLFGKQSFQYEKAKCLQKARVLTSKSITTDNSPK